MTYETLLIGLLVALLWLELTDISPGGIIVPGYIALSLDQPLRILLTLAAALLTLACLRWVSANFIVFGRRRFVLLILFGALAAEAWVLVFPYLARGPAEMRVVGLIIPGILAASLARQKMLPTLASCAGASVMTFALAALIRGVLG
jgi:poly-gamma-glutamate biosynthesis protein PgsC/CapC